MKRITEPKHKTSISINAKLWKDFDDEIKERLGVRDFSPALEILIKHWLNHELVPDVGQSPANEVEPTEYSTPVTSLEHSPGSTIGPEKHRGRPFELLKRILEEAPQLAQDAIKANLEAFALLCGGQTSGEDSDDAEPPGGLGGIIKTAQSAARDFKAAKKRASGDPGEATKRRKA